MLFLLAFVVCFLLVSSGTTTFGGIIRSLLGGVVMAVIIVGLFTAALVCLFIFTLKGPEQKLHDCLNGYVDRGENIPPAPHPEDCYFNYHLVVPQTSTIGPPMVQDCSNEYANKHGGHCSPPFLPGHHPADNDASPVIVGKCIGSCPPLPAPQQQRPVPPSPNAPAAPIQGFQTLLQIITSSTLINKINGFI